MNTHLRPVLRGLALGALGLVLGVVVLALAWVASNWMDDAPAPTPTPLLPGPAQPGSPLFFKVQGMLARAGADPEAVGRADWQRLMTTNAPDVSASAPELQGRLPSIKGLPLNCRAPTDCPKVLASSAAQIAAQLQPHALLGERCVAALADLRYEEALPPKMTINTPLPAYVGGVSCELWFKGQALTAAAQGDRMTTLQRLHEGRRLVDALLGGSRILIGKMVAAAMARSHFDAITAVSMMRPEWAADLAPLMAALPPGALDGAGWIVTEAAFFRGTVDELPKDCALYGQSLALSIGSSSSLLGTLACKTGIGLLPNATRQAMDRHWLKTWTLAHEGLDLALDQAVAEAAHPAPAADSGLVWRNTFGAALVSASLPDWGPYFARQADVELHRQALALALAALAQKVPTAERMAWLDKQGLAPRLRSRLSWAEGAAELRAKPWMSDLSSTDPRKADMRIPVAAP